MPRMQAANAKTPREPAPERRPAPAGSRTPRSRQLRLDLLHTFEAAARHLSFTRAGAELFLSQSAVSRQIQQLEDSVGAALFERRHRALALTDSGPRSCSARWTTAWSACATPPPRVRGTADGRQVAITCTPGFASFWLIPRLARFTAAHPEVDVRISATLDARRPGPQQRRPRRALRAQRAGPRPACCSRRRCSPCARRTLLRDPRRPLKTPADLAAHTLLDAGHRRHAADRRLGALAAR